MDLEIFWTQFAINKLNDINYYYKLKGGNQVAKKLVRGIVNKTTILKSGYLSGQKEPFLQQMELDFRYLVYKNYKIIYYFNNKKNRIEITNIFDCRQNPHKVKAFKNK